MASFAFAHYTDNVEKRYKIHVGSIVANMTYFHVDKLKTIDTNCNGEIWGDEINITIYEDPDTCTWYVLIACDPIPPSFELDTTLVVHNVGKLPWEATWEIMYWGPLDNDTYGCFDGWDEDDFTIIDRVRDDWRIPGWYFENGLIYDVNFWRDGVLASPTEYIYHPCTNLTITQNVTLLQPPSPPVTDPNDVSSDDWQKNIQCHWFYIWVKITVKNPTPEEYSSATWNGTDWEIPADFP